MYGVPEVPKKPSVVYGVPHIPKQPSFAYGLPEAPKSSPFVYVAPELSQQSPFFFGGHHGLEVPHGIPNFLHVEAPEIPKKFVRNPVVSHYKYELPEHTVVKPSKVEVPLFHYTQPAPIYGLPHF